MKRYIIFHGWGPKKGGAKDSFFFTDDLVEAYLKLEGCKIHNFKSTTFQWAHAFDTETSKVVAEWKKTRTGVEEIPVEEEAA